MYVYVCVCMYECVCVCGVYVCGGGVCMFTCVYVGVCVSMCVCDESLVFLSKIHGPGRGLILPDWFIGFCVEAPMHMFKEWRIHTLTTARGPHYVFFADSFSPSPSNPTPHASD